MRWLRTAFYVALTCTPLSAQDKLTKLNVVAVDHLGQPVTDLRSSDLQIQEDGKSRNLAFFRFTGDGRRTDGMMSRQLAPDEYSNRTATASSATVILLDLLSDRTLTGAMISDQLTRSFKNLDSSEGLYLYFLTATGDLYPVHPLPKSQGAAPVNGSEWKQNVAPLIQVALEKLVAFQTVDNLDPKVRLELTSRAIRQLGAQMQIMNGRKNLIWVTRGIPLNGRSSSEPGYATVDFTNQLRMLGQTLERGQIAVYPVGAELNTERYLTLEEMANLTGGRKFPYGAVGEAIRRALSDSRANYQIAFYSAAVAADGEHHKYRIISPRKDVHLETLPGYYDLMSPVQPTDVEKMALSVAIRSPFDATEVGLRARASADPDSSRTTNFDIRIDPADLLLHRVRDHYTGRVMLLLAANGVAGESPARLDVILKPQSYTSRGAVRLDQPGSPLTLDLDLTPLQYAAASSEGIVIQGSATVAANVLQARVIVVDSVRGDAGAVTIPIRH